MRILTPSSTMKPDRCRHSGCRTFTPTWSNSRRYAQLLWPEVAQNFCDGNVAFYSEWYGWYSYFQDPESCEVAGKFGIVAWTVGAGNDSHRLGRGTRYLSLQCLRKQGSGRADLVKFLTSEAVAYDEGKLGLLPVRDDVWARVIADASASDVRVGCSPVGSSPNTNRGRFLHPAPLCRLDFFHRYLVSDPPRNHPW